MPKSKILVFNLPQHGHINPTLAVVKELAAHGDELIYYLTDEFKDKIQSTGVTFRRYENVNTKPTAPSFDAFPSFYSLFFQKFVESTRLIIPQFLDELRADKPDYIMYDSLCLWAKFLAKVLQVPAITLHATYPSNEHFSLFKMLDSGKAQPSISTSDLMLSFRDELEQVCISYGIESFEPSELFAQDEPLNIVFLPRAFHPVGDTFNQRFVFVGPSLTERADVTDFPLEQLTQQPTLYISLGTLFNTWIEFFQMCFTAFGDQHWQVVMSIGKNVDRSSLGSIPNNFIVASFVPQLAVLENTNVFLTHGGMNSVMEALYHGVPLVVIPQMPEQAITAKRVMELGLGVALEKTDITVSALQAAVAKVANEPQFRQNTQQMREIIQEAGGYQQAVNAILQFKESMTKPKD